MTDLARTLAEIDRLFDLAGRVTVVTYREPAPRVARPLPAALVERVARAAEVRR